MPAARLLRVARLPAAERARALEAVVLFHGCRALLWAVPIGRLRPLLGTEGPLDTTPETTPEAPSVLPAVWGVRKALRRASRATPDSCLPQALAGRLMLRRRGLPSTLSLGVRHDGEGLQFHAWLRSAGVLVNPGGGPRQYEVLSTFHDDAAVRRTA